ncbi:Protein-lysine N-methyltransferase efm4 [Oleoguttula sp. CCFEE 5521]
MSAPSSPAGAGPRLLNPSELGTKDYWERAYALELSNHASAPEDEGTVWFDESNAETAVCNLLDRLEEDGHFDRTTARVLDLGTGNGHMLFTLREEGYEGELVGVDYSAASVALARRIEEARELDDGQGVRFEEWDVLTQPPGDWFGEDFEIVLDKGTFDAISLMPREHGTEPVSEVYRRRVEGLVKSSGVVVVTSCNWTKEEVCGWLAQGNGGLEFLQEAKYPSFKFGGRTGQSVVTIAFQKKSGV